MKTVKLTSKKEVYDFCEPYIIAEIGANHNGDMDLAKKMIDTVVKCGAHAVKFQSWTLDSLSSRVDYERNQKYNDSPKKHFGSLREMVEKYYLREEQHVELKKYCDDISVDFCSTPFSSKEVDLLERLDVPFYKVASLDIDNLIFLEYMAAKNKPIVLSTGMSTLGEIENAIKSIEKAGNTQIVLLHCISIYPPKYEDINLRNIETLRRTFGYPVGFSDHTIGFSIPLASVALGSCIIEKHFTLDKYMPGWDHEISADPDELSIICKEAVNVNKSLGSYKRVVSADEEEKKKKFRRSLVYSDNLKEGKTLTLDDILGKRPGTGIPLDEYKYVLGRTLKKDVDKDDLISWSDFLG